MRVNFHVHSKYSYDGYNSFEAIYSNARRVGIDAIALTDHDTIDGVTEFNKWLKERGHSDLEVIPAEEITCTDGTHIIGLFIQSHISPEMPLNVCLAIKDQGGFVYFPHPSRKDGILNSAQAESAIAFGDFYEIFNAKIDNSFNTSAFERMKDLTNLAPLAGADAHYNIDVRKCFCEIERRGSLVESVVHYHQTRQIKIWGKKKTGSNNYFPLYYRFKEKLNLPAFIREAGKKMFPYFKNFKERNKKIILELIYEKHNG